MIKTGGMVNYVRFDARLQHRGVYVTTSNEALRHLEQALTSIRAASNAIQNLIAAHDYQDVAGLVANAATSLVEATAHLMRSDDEAALEASGEADDFLDAVYDIIDSETDDEE
jgi:predicted RNA-binding protein YlxR (DUF448 family)